MARDTLHATTSLDALATLYAYVVGAFMHRTNVDTTSSKQSIGAVLTCIARDAQPTMNDAHAIRALAMRLNDAHLYVNDESNGLRVNANDAFVPFTIGGADGDDQLIRDVAEFITRMTTSSAWETAPAQAQRYVRRVARYARTIANNELLMNRTDKRVARRVASGATS